MLPRSEMAGEAVSLTETATLTTTDNITKRVEPLFQEIGGGVSFCVRSCVWFSSVFWLD